MKHMGEFRSDVALTEIEPALTPSSVPVLEIVTSVEYRSYTEKARDNEVPVNPARLQGKDWRKLALCKGLEPAMFYPNEDDDEDADFAKEICGMCVARVACLEYALGAREKLGVWGGTTERERRRIIRRRSRYGIEISA